MRRLWISSATPSRGWRSYPILARYGYAESMGLFLRSSLVSVLGHRGHDLSHGEADGSGAGCNVVALLFPLLE